MKRNYSSTFFDEFLVGTRRGNDIDNKSYRFSIVEFTRIFFFLFKVFTKKYLKLKQKTRLVCLNDNLDWSDNLD